MEGVARVWEALDKLSVENPEEYKQASVIANFVIALMKWEWMTQKLVKICIL